MDTGDSSFRTPRVARRAATGIGLQIRAAVIRLVGDDYWEDPFWERKAPLGEDE